MPRTWEDWLDGRSICRRSTSATHLRVTRQTRRRSLFRSEETWATTSSTATLSVSVRSSKPHSPTRKRPSLPDGRFLFLIFHYGSSGGGSNSRPWGYEPRNNILETVEIVDGGFDSSKKFLPLSGFQRRDLRSPPAISWGEISTLI